MNKNTLFVFAIIVALLTMGAGCVLPQSDPVRPDIAPPQTTLPFSQQPPAADEPIAPQSEVMLPATTDETWKLYTSKAFGFTIFMPTKGLYAPQWEVKIVSLDDPHVNNGCYFYQTDAQGQMTVTAPVITQDGVAFCLTSADDSGAGQRYEIADFSTIIENKMVVIEFSKHTVNTDMMDCPNMTERYSLSGTACIPFVRETYISTLLGIMGTFRMPSQK